MTECEIFLSLIVKFLDPDKPTWQRALALEVLHKMTVQADLLTNFCECYDLKPHATNIFQDIVNSLGAYVHSLFVNPHMMNQTGTDILHYVLNDYKINVLSVVLLIGFCSNLWQSTTFLLSYPKCVYIFLGYIQFFIFNSIKYNYTSKHRCTIIHRNACRAWRIASTRFLFTWYLVTSSSNIYKRTS